MKLLRTIFLLAALTALAAPAWSQCPDADGATLVGEADLGHGTNTITYFNGTPVGVTSTIFFTGEFVNCPEYQGCRVQFAIANAIGVAGLPVGYPALLCGAAGGEAFNVRCITMSINCAVPTKSETWSGIKAMYR